MIWHEHSAWHSQDQSGSVSKWQEQCQTIGKSPVQPGFLLHHHPSSFKPGSNSFLLTASMSLQASQIIEASQNNCEIWEMLPCWWSPSSHFSIAPSLIKNGKKSPLKAFQVVEFSISFEEFSPQSLKRGAGSSRPTGFGAPSGTMSHFKQAQPGETQICAADMCPASQLTLRLIKKKKKKSEKGAHGETPHWVWR